ncbi:MAG: hypothetical protein ACI4J6_04300 [Oscillospiraceae bacterium]
MNVRKLVIAVSAVILCAFAGLCIYVSYEGPSAADNTVYSFGNSDKFSNAELEAAAEKVREYFKADLHFGDERRSCELIELSYDENSRDNLEAGKGIIVFDSQVKMYIDGKEIVDRSIKFIAYIKDGECKEVGFGRC